MLSQISYTPRVFLVPLFCTANILMPQDESSRQKRCKCLHLGQWWQRIVSGIRAPINSAQPPSVLSIQSTAEAKSDPVAQPHSATERKNMSREDELRWALADGTLNDLSAALGRNPDPFGAQECLTSLEQFYQHYPRHKEESRILAAQKRQLLRKYSDDYLLKLVNRTKHTPTKAQAAILAYTPLPTVLADLITDYMDSFTYQLKPAVMHYIGQKIAKFPINNIEKLLSILPRCTDEKGDNLFDYVEKSAYENLLNKGKVDPFIARCAQQIFEKYRDCPMMFDMIKVHVTHLQQDPILFASPIENKIFFKTIRDALSKCESYTIYRAAIGHCDFEHSEQYELIQDYVTAVPTLLTMHDETDSVFDHVDAACNANVIPAGKVRELLRLILEHKANPNMQNDKGNTFLHSIALDGGRFNCYSYPGESPFLEQCASQLDLTIKNNEQQTVFDIIESKIKECDDKKMFNTSSYYKNFLKKLTDIKALAIKQPIALKPAQATLKALD